MTSNPNERRQLFRAEWNEQEHDSQVVQAIKHAQGIVCNWGSYCAVRLQVRGMPNAVHEAVVDYATGEAGDD
jgi:hypothetical protein